MPDAFLWLLSWFTFLGDRDLLALSCVLAVLWLLWRGYKGLALVLRRRDRTGRRVELAV